MRRPPRVHVLRPSSHTVWLLLAMSRYGDCESSFYSLTAPRFS